METATPTITDRLREVIAGRRAELREEDERLAAADAALTNGNGAAKPKRRGPGRPRKAKGTATEAAPPSPKRRRNKRLGGTRADQAVKLVGKHPQGISATDIGKVMKIKPNYLYRVMGALEKEGKVRKDGRLYFPVSE